jgi:hypothetical protein
MAALAVLGSATRNAAGFNLAATLTTPTAGGDTFSPGPDVYLRLKTSGTAVTVSVTWPTAADQYGVAKAPFAIGGGALAATQDVMYGPFPSSDFADPSDGQVHLTYTAITGLTVGVYRATNGN